MTEKTKYIIEVLLNGGCIANGYRVLDAKKNPVIRTTANQFLNLKPLLRKSGIVYLINKSKVRQQHGNTFIKKLYKQQRNENRKSRASV